MSSLIHLRKPGSEQAMVMNSGKLREINTKFREGKKFSLSS